MAISVTHALVSAVVDEAEAGIVGPSEWNAAHTVSGTVDAVNGGFGTNISASSGVPLFAAGVPTFTSTTGTGNFVRATSPTLVTPALGTPSSVTLTNATGLPIATGVSGLAAGIATFLATPSSANLAAAITNETGSGALVFATSPTLVTPVLGTPASGTLTNCTGLPVSTGVSGLGAGVATFLATPSSANLASALTDETGSGAAVFANAPSFTGQPTIPTINLTGGQIVFPSTQSASGNANTLDDYEEGTFTPAITFVTPGNLSVAYTLQSGTYAKVGRIVNLHVAVVTSSFSHTTASGNLQITGMPFVSGITSVAQREGGIQWEGITIANYTDMCPTLEDLSATITIRASGSAQTPRPIAASDMPTGGTVVFRGGVTYLA
jgi:hypothetical protein